MAIRGLDLKILPSVFHPVLYLSTEIFLDYIIDLKLHNVKVLELGTGNGLISIYLAKHFQVAVHSSDINQTAIQGLNENAAKYNLDIKTYTSDLFDDLPKISFDYIFINPPFYQKKIEDNSTYAFYAGEDLEYFHKLFLQLSVEHLDETKVLFILSENAVIDKIKAVAKNYGLEFILKKDIHKKGELFLIYTLKKL